MDLRVTDRPIWIASPSAEVAQALATVALEEGARVAVFSPASHSIVRPLRRRFGLRALACAETERSCPSLQSAIRWGGIPFGLILHMTGPAPLAARQTQVETLAAAVAPEGAVIVLREPDDPGADEVELAAILSGDLDVAKTFAPAQTRVSLIGSLPHVADTSPLGPRSRWSDPACGAMAIFLIGGGGPSLAIIGRDGGIHFLPGALG